ncbi:MAG TPA: alpha/beta fold hydrolase [Gemmatimonadaceae bacterium]|nr:alpha/beta fold hydrolase [Gemmatimonadaceae bacterium]
MRAWFRVASAVAPTVAERQAATIFCTPKRRRSRDVERVPPGARRVLLDHGDHRLVGWEWGLGTKPIVLLVHGWSGIGSDMAPVAEALVDEGFRALAFDMPAHGKSPGKQTSLAEWLEAIAAIDRWTGGLAGVLGHSFGATAATLALEAGLSAPRAVLIAPAPGPMHYIDRVSRFIGLPGARVSGMVRELEARVGREIPYFDSVRAARSLDRPALLLHDPADQEVPWDGVRALAAAWRGARLETRSGVGHYRILRDPDIALSAAAFLAANVKD